MIKLALVVPCYNEEEILDSTTNILENFMNKLCYEKLISPDSFVLYVNDGSKDKTWEMIENFCKEKKWFCAVKLASNVGHQNALLAGMTIAKDWCDAMVSLDADLQDDIEVIKDMINLYLNGYDIIYGVRNERTTDSFFKRSTALLFYKLMYALGVKSVYNHADFRLMSNRAVNELCKYKERNLFLRGIVPLLGYKTAKVYYNRLKRTAGESKYPLKKMLGLAVNGITSFSIYPIQCVLYLGILFLFIALCVFFYALHSYFINNTIPGWTSLILSIWFCAGSILIGLGIVGEYIGKIYIEVKERPRYNIEKIIKKDRHK